MNQLYPMQIEQLSLSGNESDQFINAVLEIISECVLVVDKEGIIKSKNRAANELFQDTSDIVTGQLFTSFTIDYGCFDGIVSDYNLLKARISDKTFNLTITVEEKTFFCEVVLKEIASSYLVVLRDISDKLKSEMELISTTQKLEDAEDELNLLSLVASNTSNYVIILDKNKQVQWLNESFTSGFGYQLDELIGKNPDAILFGEDSVQKPSKVEQNQKDRSKGPSIEIIAYCKDGSKKWVQYVINRVYNSKGEVSNFVSVGTDITERKNDQIILLEAKEKAEEASRVKAQFLSVMSHEIRTPMNAVLGMSNLLMDEELTDKQRKYLDTLKFSSDHLLSLINNILDFSKIEAGKIQLERIKFDIYQLINGVKESYAYSAKEKGIALTVDWNKELPHIVMGDPTRLRQILNNLVGNAVKFTNKGSIELVCEKEKEDKRHIYFRFEVRDTGIGIPDHYKKSLFERFTQSDARVTRKFGGTGLGLAITKQLVELQKGFLTVNSQENQGSVFTVRMRFDKTINEVSQPFRKGEGAKKSLEGVRILLVEDNEINQFVAGKFLEKWNATYDIAENGQVALNALKANQYDLILMDIQMPVKDGYETTKLIRKSDSDQIRKIPIMALTAENIQGILGEAFKVGMDDFITKPFNPDELYRKIIKNLP